MFDIKEYITESNDALHEAGESVPMNKFSPAADQWLKKAQSQLDVHMKKSYSNLPRRILSFNKGRRYWRIAAEDEGNKHSRSAWAFLDTTNGDVLKPKGWSGPAKHARGNIFDAQGGMKGVGPYGPAYLR